MIREPYTVKRNKYKSVIKKLKQFSRGTDGGKNKIFVYLNLHGTASQLNH